MAGGTNNTSLLVLVLTVALIAGSSEGFQFRRCWLSPGEPQPDEWDKPFLDTAPVGLDPLYLRRKGLIYRQMGGSNREIASAQVHFQTHSSYRWFRFFISSALVDDGSRPRVSGVREVGIGIYTTLAQAQAARQASNVPSDLPYSRSFAFLKDELTQFFIPDDMQVTRCCGLTLWIVSMIRYDENGNLDRIAKASLQKVTLRCPDRSLEGLLDNNFLHFPWPDLVAPADTEETATTDGAIFFGRPRAGAHSGGVVDVFTESRSVEKQFGLTQTLESSSPRAGARFGSSISAHEDHVAISEDFCNRKCDPRHGRCRMVNCSNVNSRVYIFYRGGDGVYMQTKSLLLPKDTGFPLVLSATMLVVGNKAGKYRAYLRPSSPTGGRYKAMNILASPGRPASVGFKTANSIGSVPAVGDAPQLVVFNQSPSTLAVFKKRNTSSGAELLYRSKVRNPKESEYFERRSESYAGTVYQGFLPYSFGNVMALQGATLMADSQGTPRDEPNLGRSFSNGTASRHPGRSAVQVFEWNGAAGEFIWQYELYQNAYPGMPTRLGRRLDLNSSGRGFVACFSSDTDPVFIHGYSLQKARGRWRFKERVIANERPWRLYPKIISAATYGDRIVTAGRRILDYATGEEEGIEPFLFFTPANPCSLPKYDGTPGCLERGVTI